MSRLVPASICGIWLTCVLTTDVVAQPKIRTVIPRECSTREAERADRHLDSIQRWSDVYYAYARFEQCDDGMLAVAWSDVVVRLLAVDWQTLPTLVRLARRDPRFEAFVLRHIDARMFPERAEQVALLARMNCPAVGRVLCPKLESAAASRGTRERD